LRTSFPTDQTPGTGTGGTFLWRHHFGATLSQRNGSRILSFRHAA
jgi:hypothetical protein